MGCAKVVVCLGSITAYLYLQWECGVSLPCYPFTSSSCTMPWQKAAKDMKFKIVRKEGCVLSKLGKTREDSWIFCSGLTHKKSCRNINNFPTFNFSPVDSNFCYWYSQALSYIKKFHIKRPEEEQETANTVTLICRRTMVALFIKSIA